MQLVSLVGSFVVGILFIVLAVVQMFGWSVGWLPPFWAIVLAVVGQSGVAVFIAMSYRIREVQDRAMVAFLIREAHRARRNGDRVASDVHLQGIVMFWSRERGFSDDMLKDMSPSLVNALACWGTRSGNGAGAGIGDSSRRISAKIQARALQLRQWRELNDLEGEVAACPND